MSTNSNRYRFQETLENWLGCSDPLQLRNYKDQFEALTVDSSLQIDLSRALSADAGSIYFKAALSLAEAISSIAQGYQSWAIVKLYYSTFYLVRLSYSVRSTGIFRCGSLYTLPASVGASPTKRSGKGDHKTILKAYASDFEQTEALLRNKISGEYAFMWLMERREAVHYRDATFAEPAIPHLDPSVSRVNLERWVDAYLTQPDKVHCFLPEHASLALPVVFFSQVKKQATDVGLVPLLTDDQSNVLQRMLTTASIDASGVIASLLAGP